jgi:DNA polymerase
MTRAQKAAALNEIDVHEVRGCTRCILHKGRTQTVFGDGDPAAALLFVGEGPGEEEDRQGRPFVGRAGQLLNQMIVAMGLRREDVYIANVVKCRPPGNRTPLPDESATCSGLYLTRQLQIIRPKAIVTLGNPATQALLGAVPGITKIRGHWQKLRPLAEGLEGIPVMPTFHPAYLLRNYTVEVRKMVWDDLQKVMGLLGIKRK